MKKLNFEELAHVVGGLIPGLPHPATLPPKGKPQDVQVPLPLPVGPPLPRQPSR